MRVAVVGSEGFCLGFKMAGVTKTYEFEKEAFAAQVDDIIANENGVVIIDGTYMDMLRERKRLELQNMVDPVVIPLSDEAEDSDLRTKIKSAIGVDIWAGQ